MSQDPAVVWDEYIFDIIETPTPTTFTLYKVVVRSASTGVTWHHFFKRFSECRACFADLRSRHPALPELPERTVTRSTDPAFVAQRKESLVRWLNAVRGDAAARADRQFARFVGEDEMRQKLRDQREGRADGVGASYAECDRQMGRLAENRARWAGLPAGEKVKLLEKMEARISAVNHDDWGRAGASAQWIDVEHPAGEGTAMAEGMVVGSVLQGTVRGYLRSYRSLAQHGRVAPRGLPERTVDGGRRVVSVFPSDGDARIPEAVAGYTGEVWLQPGHGQEDAGPAKEGKLCVVLGAGNQTFLAATDVLYMLFVESCVVALKYHPIRAFNAPYFTEIFRDLTEAGYFWATEDTAANDLARRMFAHPHTGLVHMTGGVRTHDAIVWGPPDVQGENKRKGTPVLKCPMSSELGCITPWIVAPSEETWTTEELNHHAGMLAFALSAQASANCLSPKLLLIDGEWPQCADFLDALRRILSSMAFPPPYYPGSRYRYQCFLDRYSGQPGKCEQLQNSRFPQLPTAEGRGDGRPPLPFLVCYEDDCGGEPYALRNEAFAPVLSVYRTKLCEGNPQKFLEAAVDFCNDRVWGTLSATLIVHDSVPRAAVDAAVRDLRYGAIGLNCWTASCFGCPALTWGGYPGEKLDAVASGIGTVRNAWMLRGVEKSVMRGSFMAGAGLKTVQLRVDAKGKHLSSAHQLRALRNLIVTPGLGTFLAHLYHEKYSPPQQPPAERSEGQRRM